MIHSKRVVGVAPYGETARLVKPAHAESGVVLPSLTRHYSAENDINTDPYKYLMLYILAFGNPYLNEDNLALHVADSLIKDKMKDIEIVKCLSPEEVLQYTDKDFLILDVVKDIKDVTIIDDIDRLKADGMVSLHDFDLGFFLKLMKETGQITKVKIIGIPQKGDIQELKKKVLNLLSI